ncbi:MAG: MFS transporter [Chloroflexi bacterium]|nr:MFS transporter [Chloroflexota bacterium]
MPQEPPLPVPPEVTATPYAASRVNSTFRAFRNYNYRLFYFGQMISLSGTWMQTIAQAWLVLQLTDSKVALGTVTMLQFLPITIFVLFAGVIADRIQKRRFIFVMQTLAMSQAIALTVLVWSGHVQLWHVYLLASVLGLANAFEQPARQSFVVEMVGKDDLINAVALNSGLFNAARMIGPGIGGFVIATAGVKAAFMVNAVSFVPVIAALTLMDPSRLQTPPPRPRGNPIAELREGLAYVFNTPSAVMIVIVLIFIGTFGFNFTVMLPLVDRYVLHRGPEGLGLLTGALGLGSLACALLLAGRETATRRTIFIGGACFAALIGAIAVSQWYYVTILLLLGTGIAATAFQATANTSMQLTAPDHLRGRVMSVYMLLFAGSTPIGGYLTGLMAQHLGVPMAVGICAMLSMLGVVAGLAYYLTHRSGSPSLAGAATPA